VFTLHPSFNNQIRSLKSPPYEVHEEGWGEFDIGIKVYFWPDSNLRPIEVIHQLKLYPNDMAAQAQQPSKKAVVNEIYEELVFTDPEASYAKRLQTQVLAAGNQSALSRYAQEIRVHFRKFDTTEAEKHVKRIRKVSAQVMDLSNEHRNRLADIRKEVEGLEVDIKALGGVPVVCKQVVEEELPQLPPGSSLRVAGHTDIAFAKDDDGSSIKELQDNGGGGRGGGGGGGRGRKGGRKRQKRGGH